VLATSATAASGAYRRAIHACHPHAQVLEIGCPAFVPLIEAGDLQSSELESEARAYLAPLVGAGVDTVVMGCTHYPMLRPMLTELLPPHVRLVDPAESAVKRLGPLLASMGGMPEGELSGVQVVPPADRTRVCVSGCAEAFADGASRWLGYRPAVERVDLRSVG
jgi:glutamate racemase